MSNVSIGDMAQTYSFRRQSVQLKMTMDRLGNELTTGRTSDVAKRFSGDFTMVSGIEAALKSLNAYKTATKEATQFATAQQTSLGVMQEQSNAAVSALLSTSTASSQTQVQNTAIDVRQKFDAVVSALNTQVGGRSVFAGAATDKPAIASSSTILADLQVAISGQTTAAGVASAVDDWFNLPGGYDVSGYLGSPNPLSPFKISTGQNADMSVTAADTTVRETLKNLALASLVANGTLAGNVSEQALLLKRAGDGMLSIGNKQTEMRASLGAVEAQVEIVTVQTASEISGLEIARTELLSVDPYKAASELEAVKTQLETLYALTSRMSRMNLVDFLR